MYALNVNQIKSYLVGLLLCTAWSSNDLSDEIFGNKCISTAAKAIFNRLTIDNIVF